MSSMPPSARWRWFLSWLLGLAVCAALVWRQHRDNEAEAEQRFEQLAEQVQQEIETRMSRYVYGLRGARGAVIGAGGPTIDRQRFRDYSRSRELEREFPGSLGFGFIRRVSPRDEAAFVAAERRDGWPEFAVRQLAPHQGDRLVIEYIEPVEGNRAAVGLDVASEPNRRAAAWRAIRTGEVASTAPIRLVQSVGAAPPSVLLMLAIYRNDQPLDTPAQREAAAFGLTYTPLELASVLRGLGTAQGEYALWLDDRGAEGAAASLHVADHVADAAETLRQVRQMPMFGRHWQLSLQARPAFRRSLNHVPPGWLFAGLATSMSALLLLLMLYRHNTERTRQLRRQRARMAAIVDSSTDAMIVQDLAGQITAWNPGAERMYGYRAAEAIGRGMAELVVPPGDRVEESWLLQRVTHGEALPALDKVHRHRDGRSVPVTESVVPMRDERGGVIGVARVVRDVSERKAAEARIIELNAMLAQQVRDQGAALELVSARERLLFDNALSSVIVTDAEGMIVLFNAAAEQMLGYRADEVIGHAVMTQFHDPVEVRTRVKALSQRLCRLLEPGEIFLPDARSVTGDNNEWLYVHRDGHRIPVLLTVGALRDEAGTLLGFIGIAVDLSERKRLEDELRKAAELALRTARAEAANQAKSLFLAHMSHEIRTPLNAVIALTYLLLHGRLDADQRDLAEKTRMAGLSLLAIVDDVLDLSKIEAGEMALDLQPFSLRQLLRQVEAVVHGEAQRKRLALRLQLPPDLPDALCGDGPRLRQVLNNLLSNAVKFTEAGEVTLRLDWRPATEGRVALRLAVRDTGPGIDAETRERLFQPFMQADASITRRYGGTGLGLSIARRLVELMGGGIELDSEPGRGSEFSFGVELARADAAAQAQLRLAENTPEAAPGRRLRGVRVLLVDDSDINREVGRRVLALEGAAVHCASEGAQALRHLERHADAVDVVLMDLQMPAMDGYAAARQIRQRLGLTLPVLALTAQALQSEQLKARAAGMDDVILKPIDPDQLVARICRHVRRAMPPEAPARPAADVPPDWPDVEGFDRHACARRLAGDTALLERLLRRLVGVAPPLAGRLDAWPPQADAAQRRDLARQLHKLRGSAAQLGLDDLDAAVLAAETALRTEAADTGAACHRLARRLDSLCQALQPWLDQRAAAPAATEPPPDGLIDQLIEQLAAQDFAALNLYHRWAAALAARLPADAAARLAEAMRQLDLPTAQALLRELRQRPDPAGRGEPSQ